VNDINYIKKYLDEQLTINPPLLYGANIEIIGGESLLYPKLMTEITEYALKLSRERQIPLNFLLSTNGTLFDNPEVREFIEKYGKYYEMGVSIDGPKEIHDKHRRYLVGEGSTYDKIIPHLLWLFKYSKTLGVKATFTNETIFHISDSVIHLINLGFTQIGAKPAYEYPLSLKDGNKIALELIKIIDYLIDNNLEEKIHFFQLEIKKKILIS
jgi:sulfatase maturation enzyme AslB (radical SAM superfamily)